MPDATSHQTGIGGVEHGPHCTTCTCGCTCGYGGQHEPSNARCDLNQHNTVPCTGEPGESEPSTPIGGDLIRHGLHDAGWYARADLDPALVDGLVADVLDLVRERLTSPEFASHVQNWVPLGYQYPHKDPYPDTYQAALAILAETASSLTAPLTVDD